MIKRLLLVTLPLLLCFGCTNKSGHVKAELNEITPRYILARNWTASIDEIERAEMSLAIYKDLVVAASDSGLVQAYDVATGKRKWSTKLKKGLTAGVSVGDDLALVATLDGELVALDIATGAQSWLKALAREVVAPPTISGGFILAHSGDGRITALNSKDGKDLWYFDQDVPALSIRGSSRPTVVSGAVAVGFANGHLGMFILDTGEMIWEQPIAVPRGRSEISRLVDIDSSPLVYGRTLFVASYGNEVMALDLTSGQTRWKNKIATYQSLLVDGQLLFISDIEGHVHALDRRNGQKIWEQKELFGRFLTNPVAIKGNIIVGDVDGYLHVLSRETGEIVGRIEFDDEPFSGDLLVEQEKLIALSRDGKIGSYQLKEITTQ